MKATEDLAVLKSAGQAGSTKSEQLSAAAALLPSAFGARIHRTCFLPATLYKLYKFIYAALTHPASVAQW
jgi:hypothetical protein